MRIISLTSIPPRFDGLAPVLSSLLQQGADRVVLSLPRRYCRFEDAAPPDLPDGVDLLWSEVDVGPATKLLPVLRAFPNAQIAYCDDDCLYGPGWLDALAAQAGEGAVVAASGWSVARLGRRGCTAPNHDIAQGFGGVLAPPGVFDNHVFDIPECAWAVDDIWISGQIARLGIAVKPAPEARKRVTPLKPPDMGLQGETIAGLTRAAANRATAVYLHDKYGIWPPL